MHSLSSIDLNYIVYRYIQESGFTHAAFALGYEAGIGKTSIDANLVPPAALITLVQKGLQYIEMEASLSNNSSDMDEDFSHLHPMELITKDVYELRALIKERKKKSRTEREEDFEKEQEGTRRHVRDKEKQEREKKERERDKKEKKEKEEKEREEKERKEREEKERKEREEKEREEKERKEKEREKKEREEKEKKEREEKEKKEREEKEKKEREEKEKKEREEKEKKEREEKEREKKFINQPNKDMMIIEQHEKLNVRVAEKVSSTGPESMDISTNPTEIPSSDVIILEGHKSEVCACAWSPSGPLLASGSGDSTARIWKLGDAACRSSTQNGISNVLVLKHVKGKGSEKSKDVTTLDWNVDGTLLATGSYDGQARIWSSNGDLMSTLNKHKGPIFSLKWNKKGDYLLTGSFDKTAIVWDVKAEECKQEYDFHQGPTLDVDWRNNVSFATSSSDHVIFVCKVGEKLPIKKFSGHQGEVNCVKWDPTGSLLASCSDDLTAKIWSMKHEKYVHDLRKHDKEIYTIRWSPTGPGTNNPNQQLLLASASFDSTVKLWDVELGKMLCSFNGHRDPVYSLAFSPNGEYLASGSLDKSMHIWSIKEGKIVKTYTGDGGIFEVCWNKEGDKIAASFANNKVCVLDFRM